MLSVKKSAYKTRKKLFYIIGLVLLLLGLLVAFSVKWIYDIYGEVSIYTVIYQVFAPIGGTDPAYIFSYIRRSLLPAVAIVAIVFILTNNFYRKNMVLEIKKASNRLKVTLFPLIWLRTLIFFIGVGVLVSSCVWAYFRSGLNIYVKNNLTTSSFYEEFYADPSNVKLEFPEKKRNLIYLSVESLEKTLESKEDKGNKETNVIPYCTELQEKYISVENENGAQGHIVEGGGWTMGAMVSQTAGIPLMFITNSMEFNEDAKFLPGAYSLGEILAKEGYYNEYITGADKSFAGADLYLKQHGGYEIMDLPAAIKKGYLPEGYDVFWGYEDQRVFEILKKEITEKYDSGVPFNIMASTLDTHGDEVYECSLCDPSYTNVHEKVYHCVDKQIGEFVEWFEQQPCFDDTTLVITGDHMSMSTIYFNDSNDYDRSVYSVFINAQVEQKDYVRNYTTIDMYPSTLAAMGVKIEGERLGLGTNIFSDTQTFCEIYGKSEFSDKLSQNSKFYKDYIVKGDVEDVLGYDEANDPQKQDQGE